METETELLNLAKRLDKEALIKIFDLYSTPLFRYTLRLCSDPATADQIVGDVFSKLLDQISSGNGPSTNLRSYLFEIAYHRVIDEVRISHRSAPLEATESLESDTNSSLRGFENQLLFKQLLLIIQNVLTADQRHVVILRFLEGFSLKETAALLGKEMGCIKMLQNRAITALRKALEDIESQIVISPASTNSVEEILSV